MRTSLKRFAVLIASLPTALGAPAFSAAAAGPESGLTVPEASARADAPSQGSPGEVLARVNGTAITRAEVDRSIRVFLAQNRLSHELSPEARRKAEEAALEQLIVTRILYQTGLALSVDDLGRQIGEKISRIRNKFPTPKAYEDALRASDLSDLDAREVVRNDLVVSNLLEREIVGKVTVSDRELELFYQRNLDKFRKPAGTRLAQILVGVSPQALVEEKLQAREKAEKIRTRLAAGEEFAALAQSESSCPSNEQGGDLGVFEEGSMIPEFAQATASLKPGEVSQVFETQDGYHLVKLTERVNASVITFDQAKERIGAYLKEVGSQRAINEYVAELKKKARIEYAALKTTTPANRDDR